MADREIVQPRASQEVENWTNRGLTVEMTTIERQKLFVIALKACNGNISKACDLCELSRQTYYNWLEAEDTAFPEQIAEIQFDVVERRIDLAEERLDQRVDGGSGPDVRFVLKTLGAKRGYGSKSTVTVTPGAGFKDMEWPEETDDLEGWEAERDKQMTPVKPDANEMQSQEGTRDHSSDAGAGVEGAGPEAAG